MTLFETAGTISEYQESSKDSKGIVRGYITTFKPTRVENRQSKSLPARFQEDCFDGGLNELKERNNRPLKMRYEHVELIGKFPVTEISRDSVGVFAEGHVNLKSAIGREAWSFVESEVVRDFSISYDLTKYHMESGKMVADEVKLIEASLVSEPANREANINQIESLTPRDVERALRTGGLSRAAAKSLVSKFELKLEEAEAVEDQPEEIIQTIQDDLADILRMLKK